MNCDKFEKLFIQENETELLEHIKTCETCMAEYKQMLKTQEVIKEAKPYFERKEKSRNFAKIAAAIGLIAVSSFVIFSVNFVPKVSYEDSVSNAFPVDEYGLLDIQ